MKNENNTYEKGKKTEMYEIRFSLTFLTKFNKLGRDNDNDNKLLVQHSFKKMSILKDKKKKELSERELKNKKLKKPQKKH